VEFKSREVFIKCYLLRQEVGVGVLWGQIMDCCNDNAIKTHRFLIL
jgi:hypothetical protein